MVKTVLSFRDKQQKITLLRQRQKYPRSWYNKLSDRQLLAMWYKEINRNQCENEHVRQLYFDFTRGTVILNGNT